MNGALFIIIAVVAFVVFATQAGAQESRFLKSPVACIIFLLVVGGILYVIWSGMPTVVFK